MDNPWDRYVSAEMQAVFSDKAKYTGWRRMWLAIAKAQKELGVAKKDGKPLISDAQIEQLEAKVTDINLDLAREIEAKTKHDVTAHKKTYEQQAGVEGVLHLGCTSRAITDNAEILQVRDGLLLIRKKTVNAIQYTTEQAEKYKDMLTLGRTHLQPAQATTVGRRFAMYGDELLLGLDELEHRLETQRFRGIKGTVGTYPDMLALFDGDQIKVYQLEYKIARSLSFNNFLRCTGQTYPRVIDFMTASTLATIGIACGHFAEDTRLLQGFQEIEEPFEKEQEGSSAMTWKRNPKNSERMSSLLYRLNGCVSQLSTMASKQWLEGSVEDSALRRFAIPEMFFATDAILDLYMHNMRGINVYPGIIQSHLDEVLPLIASNTLILEAVKKGGNRQTLYDITRTHAQAAILEFRSTGKLNFIERLTADEKFPLSLDEINGILRDTTRFEGGAIAQTEEFVGRARMRIEPYKSQLGYVPNITV